MSWTVGPGERARLTPEGPGAAVIESQGPLPLRVRASLGAGPATRAHPGTAVVLGRDTFEVVAEERDDAGAVRYRLEPWPRSQAIRDRVMYGPRFVRAALEERRRRGRDRWAGPLVGLVRPVLEAAVALLPAPERAAIVTRLALDPRRGTLLLLLLQLGAGGLLWVNGFVTSQQARLEAQAGAYTRAGTAPSDTEIKQVYGPFVGGPESWSPATLRPFAYLFSPMALLLEYGMLTGLLRGFHFVASRQPLGDPLLSLLLAAGRGRRARRREREALEAYGPARPDRVTREGSQLLIVSSRPKPGWREGAAVRVGDDIREIRHVGLVQDGDWKAVHYRLQPLEPGRVVRGEVLAYASPAAAPGEGKQAQPREAATLRAAVQDARRDRPAPSTPATATPAAAVEPARARPKLDLAAAARTRWRVDEGEEARLSPEGPTAAVIESLGALPLRPRSEAMGVHHRPEFPGSCVLLGGLRFEVVEEQALDAGHRYRLEPWPEDAIIRGTVSYGPPLVRAAQAERLRAVERERAARWSPALAPFVGLLPEERQLLACDRLGLDPWNTTLAGAALEVVVGLAVAVSIDAGPATLLLAEVLGGAFVIPALLRLAGLLIAREISGNWLLGALADAADAFGILVAQRADATVLPLTRSAFWSRLGRPDRVEPQPDGSLLFHGLLPHLSWGSSLTHRVAAVPPALRVGNDYWSVAALEASVDRGRLVYTYHLWPQRDESMLKDLPDPRPPDPRHYQNEVLDDVARQWDDLIGAFPWLPTLLPRSVQERAYRGRGGAAAAQRWTVLSCVVFVAVGVWMLLGRDPLSLLTGLLLLGDAAHRIWRTLGGDYAPSLVGPLIADYLRPERLAYHAHLDAERRTLRERGARR